MNPVKARDWFAILLPLVKPTLAFSKEVEDRSIMAKILQTDALINVLLFAVNNFCIVILEKNVIHLFH